MKYKWIITNVNVTLTCMIQLRWYRQTRYILTRSLASLLLPLTPAIPPLFIKTRKDLANSWCCWLRPPRALCLRYGFVRVWGGGGGRLITWCLSRTNFRLVSQTGPPHPFKGTPASPALWKDVPQPLVSSCLQNWANSLFFKYVYLWIGTVARILWRHPIQLLYFPRCNTVRWPSKSCRVAILIHSNNNYSYLILQRLFYLKRWGGGGGGS